ncbi:hypothetical protein [Polycladidibacter stylochi]|uniref:hypothetical protein n=1 Tax=Polycladidibacter stylochi TaxID=1807766 RepID=UPI0012E3D3E2|nr:hypothetical protein [Pseudovibrio stylochi]
MNLSEKDAANIANADVIIAVGPAIKHQRTVNGNLLAQSIPGLTNETIEKERQKAAIPTQAPQPLLLADLTDYFKNKKTVNFKGIFASKQSTKLIPENERIASLQKEAAARKYTGYYLEVTPQSNRSQIIQGAFTNSIKFNYENTATLISASSGTIVAQASCNIIKEYPLDDYVTKSSSYANSLVQNMGIECADQLIQRLF